VASDEEHIRYRVLLASQLRKSATEAAEMIYRAFVEDAVTRKRLVKIARRTRRR